MTDGQRPSRLSTSATVATLFVVLSLAVGVAAAGPIVGAGTTFEASDSGPTITITEQLELDNGEIFSDGQTVELSGHATFTSSGETTATVDQITGTWTNVSTTDVSNGLEIDPADKQAVTVQGSSVSEFNVSAVDETTETVDFAYAATGSVDVTVTELPADTTITAADVDTSTHLAQQTTDGSGVATFTLDSGTYGVTFFDDSGGGGGGGDSGTIVNRDDDEDQDEEQTDGDDQDDEQTDDEDEGEDDGTEDELEIIVEGDTDQQGENNETSGETDGQEQEDETGDETDGEENESDDGDDGTGGNGSPEPDRLSVTILGASEGSTATIDDRATGGSSVGSTKNVAVESVSMQMAQGRDRTSLSITTYEHDVVDSESADSATVTTAAREFEESTNSVAAGYVEVEHNFDSEDLSGVSFQYTVRKSHLATLGVAPEDVQLYHDSDGESWTPVETRHVGDNETHHRFESEAPSFSVFAIGTGAEPLTLTGAELDSETITVGDTASVTATIANRGATEREHDVTLTADGDTLATESLTIGGNQSESVALSYTAEEAGDYDLAVDGDPVGTLTVQEDDETIAETDADETDQEDGGLPVVLIGLVLGVAVIIAVVVGYMRQASGESGMLQ